MTKLQLYKISFICFWWVFSAIFIIFYEAISMGFQSPLEGVDYNFGATLLIGVAFTFITGLAMAVFEVLWFNKILRKKSFGLTILLKTLFYLSCILVFMSAAILNIISNDLHLSMLHGNVINVFISEYILSGRYIMSMIFWGFSVSMVLFILQISDKFGPGVLWEFIKGKYHA